MQCYTPYRVKNRNKDINHQNLMVDVPCGKCLACKKRRSSQWSFRLNEEAKQSTSAAFLTLTYENPPITENGFHTLDKTDFQKFLKRLRKHVPIKMVNKKNVNKLKYYACGEYGTKTFRPHYHAVLFNLPYNIIQNPQIIADTWQKGHIHLANNNLATINYVVGYMTKSNFARLNQYDDRIPEFSLMSKGMGEGYLTDAMKQYYKKREIFCIVRENGHIISMPRYYKQKIFTKQQLTSMYKDWIEQNEIDFNELTYEDNRIKHEFYKNLERKDKKEQIFKRQLI